MESFNTTVIEAMKTRVKDMLSQTYPVRDEAVEIARYLYMIRRLAQEDNCIFVSRVRGE